MSNPDPAPATTDDPTVGTPAPTPDVASALNSLMPGQQEVPEKIPDTPPPPAEGPIIVTPNPPMVTHPLGKNGAPPRRMPDPEPPAEPVSLQKIAINILFVILCGFGIYYGWTMGQEFGVTYLLYVQSWGPWLRSWITARHVQLTQALTK